MITYHHLLDILCFYQHEIECLSHSHCQNFEQALLEVALLIDLPPFGVALIISHLLLYSPYILRYGTYITKGTHIITDQLASLAVLRLFVGFCIPHLLSGYRGLPCPSCKACIMN